MSLFVFEYKKDIDLLVCVCVFCWREREREQEKKKLGTKDAKINWRETEKRNATCQRHTLSRSLGRCGSRVSLITPTPTTQYPTYTFLLHITCMHISIELWILFLTSSSPSPSPFFFLYARIMRYNGPLNEWGCCSNDNEALEYPTTMGMCGWKCVHHT